MKSNHLLLLFLLLLFSLTKAQSLPDDMINPVCDGQSISTGAPGNSGINNITIPCNSFQPLSPYLDFYLVRIMSGTTFTFVVQPIGNDDYDFAAWLNPNWNNLNATPNDRKRGSQNDPNQSGIYTLGLSLTATDVCETGGSAGYPEPGMVRYYDVQPGDEILIAIDRWSNTTQGYTISFGGDAELDCTIVGNSYGKCDYDNDGSEAFLQADVTPDLLVSYPNHTFQFYTTQAAAEQGTGPQITFPYTVNATGNPNEIFARVINGNGSFVRVVKIMLYVNQVPQITPQVTLPTLCDGNQDGVEVFDLTQANPLLTPNFATYNFKYYTNLADAQANNNNNIANPNAFSSGATTIYVAVNSGPQEGNNDGCFVIGEIILNLEVLAIEATELTIDPMCDDNDDGIVTVNLNDYLNQLNPNNTNATVTFHTSQNDAEFGTNPIGNPNNHNLNLGNTTIFVRFKSPMYDCFIISKINFQIVDRPTLNNVPQQAVCSDAAHYNYDLTDLNDLFIANSNLYTFSYFNNINDANNNTNAIANPTTFPINANTTATIFVRVQSDSCFAIGSVTIRVNAAPQTNDMDVVEFCSDNPNTQIFDLTTLAANVVNNPNAYNFIYFTTEQNAELNQNPIQNPNNFPLTVGVTTTIYIRVVDNNTSCHKIVAVDIFPQTGATLNNINPIELCDIEADNIYNYNLTQLNNQLLTPNNGFTFSYYLTQQDAQNNTNAIPQAQWNNYIFNGLPTSIWVVATSSANCRSEVRQVTFVAGQSINHQTNVGPLEICTNETADFTQFESAITTETGVTFTYFNNLLNAQNDINPIANPDNFTLPQTNGTIYVRLSKQDRCDVIVPINYVQNPRPILSELPSTLELCQGETHELTVSSDDPNTTFEWFFNENSIGTGDTMVINQLGEYTLVATNAFGCTTETSIQIVAPSTPLITKIEIGGDYAVVFAQSLDGGSLEYSLNGVIWQNSPKFDHLVKGETYTMYVRESGCMITQYKFTILNISNFISPNNDGFNDVWEVRGIEVTPNATIKIFDRYGKVFVDTNFEGNYIWDGKYMGRPLPSGDYWYIMDVPSDGIVVGKKFVGHISIRNQ